MAEKNEIAELEVEVYGRVQGVYFRKMMKEYADANALKGFIKNRTDGSVLVLMQASRENLEKALFWIKSNPGFTKVVDTSETWRMPEIKFNDFSILRRKNSLLDRGEALFNLGRRVIGIDNEKPMIPVHVAVIPDGNRRWARSKGLGESSGHYKAGGQARINNLILEAKNLGVKYISIWGFSTENWSRNENEKKAIFELLLESIENFRKIADREKIRFRHIGRKDRLPKKLIFELERIERETKENNELNVQLCLDYGGRDEIIRAVNKALKFRKREITEEEFPNYLDSFGIPDPDLIIRTSGERRISGFMPYQSAYAELYFSDKYFPEFEAEDLREAVLDFGKRNRRFGGN